MVDSAAVGAAGGESGAEATLLRLLQIADSGFPTGAFAFSHGLEGLVGAGVIEGEAGVAAFLRAQVEEGLAGVEAPAMRHAYRLAAAADVAALVALDGELSALNPVPAHRAASVKVGRRLLGSAAAVVGGGVVADYRAVIGAGRAAGHHAVAFGVVVQAAGVGERAGALALGAGFVGNLAAAAVRLGVIGQGAAQGIVAGLRPAVIEAAAGAGTLAIAEMGGYLPLADIAGLRQPALGGRLFGS